MSPGEIVHDCESPVSRTHESILGLKAGAAPTRVPGKSSGHKMNWVRPGGRRLRCRPSDVPAAASKPTGCCPLPILLYEDGGEPFV